MRFPLDYWASRSRLQNVGILDPARSSCHAWRARVEVRTRAESVCVSTPDKMSDDAKFILGFG
jgi:hypothetical protein